MGRIKEYARKPGGSRKRNPVVYIICEGAETEARYFKHFRKRGCHIDIRAIPSQYRSADKLVRKVRATLGSNPCYPEDGDIIWCVFDRDDNTDATLAKARQAAVKAGYRTAFSNPSFELWFLLHFCDQTAAIENCGAAVKLLRQKGRLERYGKNKDVYDELKPFQAVAIKRAKERTAALESEGTEIISRQSNPVTTVAELVEYLNRKR